MSARANSQLAGSATIETVGKLVIAGRDRGRPIDAAEARRAQIAAEGPTHLGAFRDLLLRITVGESVDAAVSKLLDLGEEWGQGPDRRRRTRGRPSWACSTDHFAPPPASSSAGRRCHGQLGHPGASYDDDQPELLGEKKLFQHCPRGIEFGELRCFGALA